MYFPGWVGGGGGGDLVKSKLWLNSAKAEAKASSLGLAELGKNDANRLRIDSLWLY